MPENELLKASFALEYTPAYYYRMIRGRKVYEESLFPTFTLRYDRAFPLDGAKLSPSYHLSFQLGKRLDSACLIVLIGM